MLGLRLCKSRHHNKDLTTEYTEEGSFFCNHDPVLKAIRKESLFHVAAPAAALRPSAERRGIFSRFTARLSRAVGPGLKKSEGPSENFHSPLWPSVSSVVKD